MLKLNLTKKIFKKTPLNAIIKITVKINATIPLLPKTL